jgi:hypothetical protein
MGVMVRTADVIKLPHGKSIDYDIPVDAAHRELVRQTLSTEYSDFLIID